MYYDDIKKYMKKIPINLSQSHSNIKTMIKYYIHILKILKKYGKKNNNILSTLAAYTFLLKTKSKLIII